MSGHCDDAGRQRFSEEATENVQKFCKAMNVFRSITATNVITPQHGTQTLNSYPQNILLFILLENKKSQLLFFSTLRGKCRLMYLKNTIYTIHIHNNYILSNHSLISDDLIKITNGMAFFSLPRYCAMSGKHVQV